MWTKIVNYFGLYTRKQQKQFAEESRKTWEKLNKTPRISVVITTKEVPVKGNNKGSVKRPTQTVRRGADTDWQVVGYTNHSPFVYGDVRSSGSDDSGSPNSGGDSGGSASFSCD